MVGPKVKVTSWLNTLDDPSTRTTSAKRTDWDPKEAAHLPKVFRKFDKLPPMYVIRKIMASDPMLREILERDGWSRIYNKVDNEIRAKK